MSKIPKIPQPQDKTYIAPQPAIQPRTAKKNKPLEKAIVQAGEVLYRHEPKEISEAIADKISKTKEDAARLKGKQKPSNGI